jgi:starvation-inducible outer membrane lipoprotein
MPVLTAALIFTACQQQPQHAEGTKHTEKASTTAMQDSIAVVPFQLENGGWGYKINKGSHTYIEQPFIPVIVGNKPFQSEADARKVGEHIAAKIRKSPGGLPDLTRQELLEMKIAGVE